MTSYQDATRWACDQVEEKIVDGRLDFPECTFAETLIEVAAGLELVQPEDAESYYLVTEQLAEHLWLLSMENDEFFDFCARMCATNLLADAPLPECLRIFASQVLSGDLKRPTPPNRPRTRNWLEQMFLWSTIKGIEQKFDLNITRNDVPASSYSACDVMAEALTVCGRKTKYSEIKNLMVHKNSQRFREEILAYVQIGRRKNLRGLDPDATAAARALEAVREIRRTLPREKKPPSLRNMTP